MTQGTEQFLVSGTSHREEVFSKNAFGIYVNNRIAYDS